MLSQEGLRYPFAQLIQAPIALVDCLFFFIKTEIFAETSPTFSSFLKLYNLLVYVLIWVVWIANKKFFFSRIFFKLVWNSGSSTPISMNTLLQKKIIKMKSVSKADLVLWINVFYNHSSNIIFSLTLPYVRISFIIIILFVWFSKVELWIQKLDVVNFRGCLFSSLRALHRLASTSN